MKRRDLIAGVTAGLCIAPSAVCNVLPHVLAIYSNGRMDSGATSLAIFQGASVVAMAAMPFATKSSIPTMHKLACWLLSFVLLFLNFLNALDVANAVRESATGVKSGTISKAAALESRIADLTKSRAQVPPHNFVSAASASAAQSAVAESIKSRDAECAKVGTLCRKRMDEAKVLSDALPAIMDGRALTDKADKLDSELHEAQSTLADLGPIPKHSDDTAAKLAMIASIFVKVDDASISDWRPIWFAFGIELLALIGPIGMFGALSGRRSEKSENEILRSQKIEPAALEKTALSLSPATPAKPKKVNKTKPKTVAGLGDVREFFECRTTARAGSDLRCNEVYEAYCSWCESNRNNPVSLTRFGTTAKGDLGIEYREKSKRGYYANLALKGATLKVVKA